MAFHGAIIFKVAVDGRDTDTEMQRIERKLKTRINNMVGIRTQAEVEYNAVWRKFELERTALAKKNLLELAALRKAETASYLASQKAYFDDKRLARKIAERGGTTEDAIAMASRRRDVLGRRRMSLAERAERDKEDAIAKYQERKAGIWAAAAGSSGSIEHYQEARLARRIAEHGGTAAERERGVEKWKQGLAEERKNLGIKERIANTHGVNIANLAANVVTDVAGGRGGGLGTGGSRNSMFAEVMVAGREALAGRYARLNYTMSVLAQRSGLLGRALSALATPFGTAITAVVGAGVLAYAYSQQANAIIRGARRAGFSVSGLQEYNRRADRFGEGDAAGGGLSNLVGLIGAAQSGDEGAFKKFRARGISIEGKTNEQIYAEVRAKIKGESNAGRRQVMGREFFGSDYLDMERSLMSDEAGDAPQYTAAELRNLQAVNPTGKSLWQHFKGGLSKLATLGGKGLALVGDLGRLYYGGSAPDQEAESLQLLLGQKALLAERKAPQLSTRQKLAGMGLEGQELGIKMDTLEHSKREADAAIEDLGKEGLTELAEKGRHFTGQPHRRNYAMTARMRTALKIEDLEERSTVAWERGDDAGMKRFRDQAEAMREDPKNAWLKFQDKDSVAKLKLEQSKLTNYFDIMTEMAKEFVADHKPQ